MSGNTRHRRVGWASPRDGRTGAQPDTRAIRHDADPARGEHLRIEREEEFVGPTLPDAGEEEMRGRPRAKRALPHQMQLDSHLVEYS